MHIPPFKPTTSKIVKKAEKITVHIGDDIEAKVAKTVKKNVSKQIGKEPSVIKTEEIPSSSLKATYGPLH